VLDTARDSGLTLGDGSYRNYNSYPPQPGPSLLNFKIADPKTLREQAYKEAMDDAKAKAQSLADLAGVKLGKVVSVRDSASKNTTITNPDTGETATMPTVAQNEFVSSTFNEIPLNVRVTVQFEIVK